MAGYQLKITIEGSHPPIWRRVLIPDGISFADLDRVIEEIFGWEHAHLYEFYFPDFQERVTWDPTGESLADDISVEDGIDEFLEVGSKFIYTYDFGDDWRHIITVEKLVEYEERFPQVIKFKGPNMIEDCGGIYGFYNFIDKAEPFDMDAVNEKMSRWSLDQAEEGSMWDEEELREYMDPVESLSDVFIQYKKEDLTMIARSLGFSGYSKLKKAELAVWLKDRMLDRSFMERVISRASAEDLEFFQQAVDRQGVVAEPVRIAGSLFLSAYGAMNVYSGFYQVPLDVQEQYRKICTPEVFEAQKKRANLELLFEGAVYLYGVVSVERLRELYERCEGEKIPVQDLTRALREFADEDDLYCFDGSFLMDGDLEEEGMYLFLLEEQKQYEPYMPQSREELYGYGEFQVQAPDENTEFFLLWLKRELNLSGYQASALFCQMQDCIRMNCDWDEVETQLGMMNIQISAKKKRRLAKQMDVFERYIRKWDLAGHTQAELEPQRKKADVVDFGTRKKIYPNDPCPCGSGKKYKHCCGKGKS